MASKSAAAAATASSAADLDGHDGSPALDYKYQVEISQMMFVFGDVTDPHPDVTKLIEDIVRNQTIEMIIQSRRLAQRRGSKYLSAEDLIFLIRYDRAKINRLRTYLSWKDVRKNAKDSGDGAAGGPGGGAADVDGLAEDATIENPVKATMKKIRLPWDFSSAYSEFLRPANGAAEDEEEDEDDIEAHEDSMQRLRDADEATRRMTREEYVHYSECRQASFTFRRGKRFREFINAGAYLDVKPNDDIIDILGFLAFEVVRELVLAALAIKRGLEEQDRSRNRASTSSHAATHQHGSTAHAEQEDAGAAANEADVSTETARPGESTTAAAGKRKTPPPPSGEGGRETSSSPSKRKRSDSIIDQHQQQQQQQQQQAQASKQDEDDPEQTELCGLFTLRPTVEKPLKPAHIHEAFAKLQRGRAALVSGMRGAGGTGGLRRTRVFVI
ncbi:uncharacterized protein PFL1_00222 [Pseudozyma flocculosa PF-1]|uniref:Related to SPT3 - general transcriptional adaptor or co-activator n=1 Tax=Pseudozyma flocculosa TaxID=84751 RepID=A0A5C3ET78_9BASI|nr:uncharacterized protein PFL1_00222 [Pseudozyma flocculosa PF-1]EPQ32024.1 hypothetical protein PFL1_00222 [Pseudozyma flocculosa PF-1]SPO35050.1 related to SPT3 - general transcriptional adaptor or co-activator [Pseudozyma flocculosa]